MTQMVTRPVLDNRILSEQATLSVSLGAATSAVFGAPMMGGLAATAARSSGASTLAYTDAQREQLRADSLEVSREIDELNALFMTETDPARRQELTRQVERLQERIGVEVRAATQESIAAGRLKTPEELNEEYSDLGVTFSAPMTPEQAEIIADGKRAEIIRNAIVEAGPKGFVAGTVKLGAGLAAMVTDPLEVASMFIPVVSGARAAALTARFGKVGGRAAVGAIEGLVGSAITEPIYYGLSKSQQLDYTMSDSLLNIGLGAFLGAGIGAAIGKATRAVDIPVTARDAAHVALRQFVNGDDVNVSHFFDGRDLRSGVSIARAGGVEYQVRQASQEALDVQIVAARADGAQITLKSREAAQARAERLGGEVISEGEAYKVHYRENVEIVRNAGGAPVEFNTRSAAQSFIEKAGFEDAAPVRASGAKSFVVARGEKKAIAKIDGAEWVKIAKVEDAGSDGFRVAADGPVLTGRAAEVERAKAAMPKPQDARPAADVAIQDLPGAPRAQDKIGVASPEDAMLNEDIEMMAATIDAAKADGDLSAVAVAELDEVAAIDAHAKAYADAAKAAAACLVGVRGG